MVHLVPNRLDQLEAELVQTAAQVAALQKIVALNTELIETLSHRAAVDRATSQSIREDVDDLVISARVKTEISKFQERQIKIHEGKIHAVTALAERMYSAKSHTTK